MKKSVQERREEVFNLLLKNLSETMIFMKRLMMYGTKLLTQNSFHYDKQCYKNQKN